MSPALPCLHLIRAGLSTTIQDFGRIGHQHRGMTTAGAMDVPAMRVANALVGNPEDAGVLEMGYIGAEVEIDADTARIAVCGDVTPTLSSAAAAGEKKPLVPWRSYTFVRGDRLNVGPVQGSAFAYLAVGGGMQIAPFMGSVSTYTRAGLGGIEGRTLRDGDRLPLVRQSAEDTPDKVAPHAPERGTGPVRVVLGPQDDYFTEEAIETFLSQAFPISKEADRMGQRLEGPQIRHRAGFDIPSDGIAKGSTQVPGTGHPILLLADHQTVGGYPKIATVISADIPRACQMLPGMAYHFTAVSVEAAEAARRAQEAALSRLIAGIRPALPEGGVDLDALHSANLISGAIDALG